MARRWCSLVLASLLVLSLVPAGATGEDVVFVHEPYIQSLTPTAVTLKWETSEPTTCYLYFGRDPGALEMEVVPGSGVRFELGHSGLMEGTTYHYRVETTGGSSERRAFTTPGTEDASFDFTVYGDSRTGHTVHGLVVDMMESRDPELVLHTGDLVNDGDSVEDWDRFLDIAHPLMVDTPLWPTKGNHDLPDYHYRHLLLDDNYGDYYSFDWQGAHFVSLDSTGDLTVGSEQYRWLEEDLVTDHSFWTFVFFHHPPYSSGKHGPYEDLRRDLDPLFAQHCVTAVFNGHDHCYEHTLPPSGVHYFVTGGGGGPLYDVGGSDWTVESASVHHFLHVRVSTTGVVIDAVDVDGRVIERTEIGDYGPLDDLPSPSEPEDDLSALALYLSVFFVLAVVVTVVLFRTRQHARGGT